jgi:hypothetical protein
MIQKRTTSSNSATNRAWASRRTRALTPCSRCWLLSVCYSSSSARVALSGQSRAPTALSAPRCSRAGRLVPTSRASLLQRTCRPPSSVACHSLASTRPCSPGSWPGAAACPPPSRLASRRPSYGFSPATQRYVELRSPKLLYQMWPLTSVPPPPPSLPRAGCRWPSRRARARSPFPPKYSMYSAPQPRQRGCLAHLSRPLRRLN